jgi:sporulation protein YlmC with PRC-barrel domain
MRTRTLLIGIAVVSAISASPAFAACRIDTQTAFDTQMERVTSAKARDDLKTLRNAAEILKRNDKDEACVVVVRSMTELRTAFSKTASASDSGQVDRRLANASETNASRVGDGAVPVRMRASKLMGADLIGSNGDEVAEIDDLVLNKDGADYAIVSFGGFLGLGDEQAAVPVSQIRAEPDPNDKDEVVLKLPMTVAQLKSAPRFKKNSQAWFGDDGWWSKNDSYYSGMASTQQ